MLATFLRSFHCKRAKLHLLPFKALQDSTGAYLTEKQQLITLSSARDIVLPPTGGATQAAAIFAGPDYCEADGEDTVNRGVGVDLKTIRFNTLSGALKEGQQIDGLFGKQTSQAAQLFTKAKATEQQITAINAPKILHLARTVFSWTTLKLRKTPTP